MTAKTGARLHGWTMKDRRHGLNNRYAERALNDWHGGDLPAPFAQGDIVHVPASSLSDRTRGMVPGYALVTYCPSIDEGDAWYVRLMDVEGNRSDRLHLAWPERASRGWAGLDTPWMNGITLVETADPDGLAERERLLAAGWSYSDTSCPHCDGTGKIGPS